MSQEIKQANLDVAWPNTYIAGSLAGDVAAATISATAISPLITAIDRAVVENAASSSRPLLYNLKQNILCSFRHPRLFFAAKPFFYVWTLYAATYTTANSVETVLASQPNVDHLLAGSITFLSTCLVNVPLGVWKDVRFVQLFGRPSQPISATSEAVRKSQLKANSAAPSNVVRAKFPRLVGATFLLRDAITIFGSITLPPMLASPSTEGSALSPAVKLAAMQIFTPVLSQIFATPVHLLGLDLYSNPDSTRRQRVTRMKKTLGPTTAMRCSRIIPAFGVGLVLNTGLRDHFHELARRNQSSRT